MMRPNCTSLLLQGVLVGTSWVLTSCAINFELTSQRTALENQMLGSYEQTNDDLYLISSIRKAGDKANSLDSIEVRFQNVKKNQMYNMDDLDELKTLQIIGEDHGVIEILPSHKGLVGKATSSQLNLAKLLIKEENHDREVIWRYTIESNENLKADDLKKVRDTYAEQIFKSAKPGHWFQTESGWIQKTEQTIKKQ